MRLTDIMSHLELHVYAEIGLIIFLIAFFAVVIRVLTTKRVESERMASLPLEDDTAAPSSKGETSHGA